MAILVEIVVWLVVELLLQLLGEVLIALGVESFAQSLGRREKPHWALAGVGCLLIGGIAGLLVTLIYTASCFAFSRSAIRCARDHPRTRGFGRVLARSPSRGRRP